MTTKFRTTQQGSFLRSSSNEVSVAVFPLSVLCLELLELVVVQLQQDGYGYQSVRMT